MKKIDIEKDYGAERIGTNSSKWDGLVKQFGEDGLLPMWVADMDFKSPDCVREALQKLVDLGVYGYYIPPQSYYQAFIDWEKRKHGYEVKKDWIRYSAGVVSGIYWVINAMTQPGDPCIILSPCYYPFMNAINGTGRKLICSELVNSNGFYTIDFDKFENDITENKVKLFILCSPHNPVGRIWSREELGKLLEICKRHDVFVISDEIHHDLELFGNKHTPTATVGEYDDMLITLTAASKTFNLAGCQNSFVIIPSEQNREKYDTFIQNIRMINGSLFGYIAAEAAYKDGEPWLREILGVIEGNYKYLRDSLLSELPQIVVSPLEGTYLMWIDLGAYVSPDHLKELVQGKCRLAVDYGEWFLDKKPDTHIRINLATQRKNVEEAARRLIREIKKYIK